MKPHIQKYSEKLLNENIIEFYEEIYESDGKFYPMDAVTYSYVINKEYNLTLTNYADEQDLIIHQFCEVYSKDITRFLYYIVFCINKETPFQLTEEQLYQNIIVYKGEA